LISYFYLHMTHNATRFFQYHALLIAVLIICIATLESCAPEVYATNITASWKDPQAKTYRNFFVAALVKNRPARTSIESNIWENLKRERVKATKSLDILGHSEKVETAEEKKAAVEKIRSLGYDAVVVVTLLRTQEESRWVEGASSYTPANIGVGSGYINPLTNGASVPGAYGAFGMYYIDASTPFNTPGYYEKDKTYFVQCNVYDVETTNLVWSAQSETFDPGNVAAASDDFAHVMVNALKAANIIYKKEKK
jgi:hypothetical protein